MSTIRITIMIAKGISKACFALAMDMEGRTSCEPLRRANGRAGIDPDSDTDPDPDAEDNRPGVYRERTGFNIQEINHPLRWRHGGTEKKALIRVLFFAAVARI